MLASLVHRIAHTKIARETDETLSHDAWREGERELMRQRGLDFTHVERTLHEIQTIT